MLVVDATPGTPAKVRTVPLTSPRRLRTVTGTVAELAAMAAQLDDALVRAVVTEPARAGLGDEVRTVLPGAVDIKVAATNLERPAPRVDRAGRRPDELFHVYLAERGIDDARLEALFVDLYDAAVGPA